MREVKFVPELQPLPGAVGNWIFLHPGLCSFVCDAAGDGGSSSFIGLERRAKTRAFCAELFLHLFELQVIKHIV